MINDLEQDIWSIYECGCIYLCSLKYCVGVISILFTVLYSFALWRVNRRKSYELDVRDKILLSIALTQSIFILLYFLFFNMYFLRFVMRMVNAIEQVTICYILFESITKKMNLMRTFWITVAVGGLIVASMLAYILYNGSQEFLFERNTIWIVISGVQFMIALVTIILGGALMRVDP